MNEVFFSGKMLRDPVIKTDTKGICTAKYSLYSLQKTTRFWEVNVINCLATGVAGEIARDFLGKDKKVLVKGYLANKETGVDIVVEYQEFDRG